MNIRTTAHQSDPLGMPAVLRSETVLYFALGAAILLSYGYEIFNFNLTIDEEIHAFDSMRRREWIAQGRWGMAILNYFLVQNPVGPVTSTFIGVIGATLGMLLLLNKTVPMEKVGVIAITALAITTPTLPFIFTFNTIAYGIGAAFLALAISASLISRNTLWSAIPACGFAAFALGIYQPFAFALAMLAVVHAWRYRTEPNPNLLTCSTYSAVYLIGSILIYLLLNWIALKAAPMDATYLGRYVDMNTLFENPARRITASFNHAVSIVRLHSSLFGTHSVWLSVVVLVSMFFSFAYPIAQKRHSLLLRTSAILFAVVLLIVLAGAIPEDLVPLRTVVYIPVGIAIVVAAGYAASGAIGKYVLIALCCLAVIGNSMVNNHLFASSAAAEFRDRMLVQTIIKEVQRLHVGSSDRSDLKVEVVGNLAWPETGIQSKRETFGASFFEWDGGNSGRVASYLSLNGLRSVPASDEERVRVYEQQKLIPAWPSDGWVTVKDDLVILKLGAYSRNQQADLCAKGVAELCDNSN